jgi:hypothetical protein
MHVISNSYGVAPEQVSFVYHHKRYRKRIADVHVFRGTADIQVTGKRMLCARETHRAK